MQTHVNVTCVNETDAMYEKPRVNVKVERVLTFTYTLHLPYIVSVSFKGVKFTRVRTQGENFATMETDIRSISLGCKIP